MRIKGRIDPTTDIFTKIVLPIQSEKKPKTTNPTIRPHVVKDIAKLEYDTLTLNSSVNIGSIG